MLLTVTAGFGFACWQEKIAAIVPFQRWWISHDFHILTRSCLICICSSKKKLSLKQRIPSSLLNHQPCTTEEYTVISFNIAKLYPFLPKRKQRCYKNNIRWTYDISVRLYGKERNDLALVYIKIWRCMTFICIWTNKHRLKKEWDKDMNLFHYNELRFRVGIYSVITSYTSLSLHSYHVESVKAHDA